jgi:hypothetical protein
MFDSEGSVVHQEESLRTRDRTATQAVLYFTIFDTFRLGEVPPSKDKDLPTLFTRLEAFVPAKREIKAGRYLICVYGDNFLGRTNYNIVAVPAKNDMPEVRYNCVCPHSLTVASRSFCCGCPRQLGLPLPCELTSLFCTLELSLQLNLVHLSAYFVINFLNIVFCLPLLLALVVQVSVMRQTDSSLSEHKIGIESLKLEYLEVSERKFDSPCVVDYENGCVSSCASNFSAYSLLNCGKFVDQSAFYSLVSLH